MRRWLILAALLLPWTLAAQTGIPVTALWDLDPSHDAPGLTWELERDGVIYPCGNVTVTATERRCAATVPALAGVYRLRGVTATGEPGPWSGEGSGTQTAPGAFTITWHSPITLTEPEPEPDMAVAHDGEANLTGRQSSSATWTLSGKTTAGSDRIGIVRWMSGFAPTSITWGGNAMTDTGVSVARGSATIRAYYILNPPTGSSDIVITTVGPTSGPYCVSSYNGVDQTTPIGATNTATGTGTTPTVDVSSAADNLVLDAMDVANVISSVGANQTAEFIDTAGGLDRFGASREAGAGTTTMSWTVASGAWSILAFELNAAGGGYSLALDAASVGITGQAVGLRAARRLAIDASSLSLTGQAVTLRAARRLVMDAATVTIAGQEVALRRGLRLSLEAASLTISGQTVGLSAARRLTLDAAALTISGSDVTLVPPAGAYSLALDPASVSLSGQPLTLRAGRQLALDASSTAVTGQALTLRATRTVTLSPATLALAGADVGLVAGRRLALDPSGLTVTGQPLTLRADRRLPLEALVVTVTGGALVFDYSGSLIGIIDLAGAYTPVITLAGAHTPVIAVPGAYTPTVTLAGVLEA